MTKYLGRIFAVMAAVLFLSITVLELTAEARAGGGRSSGSRGSRSYSSPAAKNTQPSQSRQQMAPAPSPLQQSAGGGFMRSMAGGIMGGLLGGMLFSSLGFAGAGGTGGMNGGGGIGLFEIILIGGLCYLIYRFIKKKREESAPVTINSGYQRGAVTPIPTTFEPVTPVNDVATGIGHVRQMDSSFDETHFNDMVMDIFFKVQGAWMNRSLDPVAGLLTDDMRQMMQEDVNRLLQDNQVNRLENIAVRKVETAEVWQESGNDFITALIYANLLDYTTEATSGAVVAGSKTEPVKFEEYWTFTRPVGNNQWRLSAISQK